jgi:DnaK suppressor protein
MTKNQELTDEQTSELREVLVAAKDEVERSVSTSTEEAKPVDLGLSIGRLSRVDALQQQHMALARKEREKVRLQQIRAALARLDEGTYGDCLSCGEPVGYARLRVRPETPFCRTCQK